MNTNTFLTPIEKPKGLTMKLAYYFTRRQFGKVLTPLKVWAARLPAAFGLFSTKISKLDKKLTLSPGQLVRETNASAVVGTLTVRLAKLVTLLQALDTCTE